MESGHYSLSRATGTLLGLRVEGSTSVNNLPSASVVICAFTEERWDQTVAAIESVRLQNYPPIQIVVVVDHNETLRTRIEDRFDDIAAISNTDTKGLSGGRNCGVRTANGEVIAFLDDDATADPEWLSRLLTPYLDPRVIGTGGHVIPVWPQHRPPWFPPEFDWVIGCSYLGLPVVASKIRNPIGANMSFRQNAFTLAGGFDGDIGRLGSLPLGCEETVFSIRLQQRTPGAVIHYVPNANVHHYVSKDRTHVGYFFRRCVAEGISKAMVTAYVGRIDGLQSERSYVLGVLTRGFIRGLCPDFQRKRRMQPLQSAMIVFGLGSTVLGFILGRLRLRAVSRWLIMKKT